MVIGEHTNAYHSSEKINPLISPLGITIEWTTACDVPEFCSNGNGWLILSHFDSSHPTNSGVTSLHFLTGATLNIHAGTIPDSHGYFARSQGTVFTSPGYLFWCLVHSSLIQTRGQIRQDRSLLHFTVMAFARRKMPKGPRSLERLVLILRLRVNEFHYSAISHSLSLQYCKDCFY